MAESKILRLATRGSALALWQADRVSDLIRAYDKSMVIEPVIVSTRPDRNQDRPLSELGGDKGLFVREVEQAILGGLADAAVHSLKDVPVETLTPGLNLVAFPEREDARDCLVSRNGESLAELRAGSMVATGAPRRQAQLLAARPDLKVCGVRGNVGTRLQKLRDGQFDAIVMAAAGLKRLGLEDQVSQYFDLDEFVPAPGQGIIAVQAPTESPFRTLWAAIDRPESRLQAETEREFSRLMEADCYSAAGCNLEVKGVEAILRARICSGDGRTCLGQTRAIPVGRVPEALVQMVEQLIETGGLGLR